jgi:hypothetical protein
MEATEVIAKALETNAWFVDLALSGLTDEQLNECPSGDSNPAGWLWWHQCRVEDFSIAHATGGKDEWAEGGWTGRFGIDVEPGDIGVGHDLEKVRSLKFTKDILGAYAKAVREKTLSALGSLSPADLDKEIPDVIPEKTIRVGEFLARSLMLDHFHHSGQICYLRGHLTGFGWAPM